MENEDGELENTIQLSRNVGIIFGLDIGCWHVTI